LKKYRKKKDQTTHAVASFMSPDLDGFAFYFIKLEFFKAIAMKMMIMTVLVD
jgi:hypothetical protein